MHQEGGSSHERVKNLSWVVARAKICVVSKVSIVLVPPVQVPPDRKQQVRAEVLAACCGEYMKKMQCMEDQVDLLLQRQYFNNHH